MVYCFLGLPVSLSFACWISRYCFFFSCLLFSFSVGVSQKTSSEYFPRPLSLTEFLLAQPRQSSSSGDLLLLFFLRLFWSIFPPMLYQFLFFRVFFCLLPSAFLGQLFLLFSLLDLSLFFELASGKLFHLLFSHRWPQENFRPPFVVSALAVLRVLFSHFLVSFLPFHFICDGGDTDFIAFFFFYVLLLILVFMLFPSFFPFWVFDFFVMSACSLHCFPVFPLVLCLFISRPLFPWVFLFSSFFQNNHYNTITISSKNIIPL